MVRDIVGHARTAGGDLGHCHEKRKKSPKEPGAIPEVRSVLFGFPVFQFLKTIY